MSRVIVATNPANDIATKYLDAWHNQVKDLVKTQTNTNIFELNEEKTNRENLTKLIEEKNPNLVILNGHGNYDSIVGFDGDFLIKIEENEAILAKRIVHSIACSAGRNLGPRCIEKGTLAYIGYKEEFKITYLQNKNTREEKTTDMIANLFFEPAFEAVFSLIKGFTARDAFNSSQKKCLENLTLAISKNNPGLNTAVASRLYHNYINQVCLGDGSVFF